MRPFQVVLIGIFIALGVGGVLAFALFGGFGKHVNPYGANVTIWGVLDDAPFVSAFNDISQSDPDFKVVSYVQKDPRTFSTELVNALAEGKGPDIILFSHDMILSMRGKIAPFSYTDMPDRTFKDTYIDGAQVFALRDGIYGLPIAVDPLLMYWNRDIFSTKGLSQPPRTWEELVAVTVPSIVERDFALGITRAAVAFGEYTNILNAKDVLSLFLIQAGSNMVYESGGRLIANLNEGQSQGIAPAQAVLNFYTPFSNPAKQVYTWNRSLPQDRLEFLSGDLALYFGFGSEVNSVRDGNPNLNFDVTEVPQGADARIKKGVGKFYGLARIRTSQNVTGATNALHKIVAQGNVERYAQQYGMAPVYRASLTHAPDNAFMTVVYRAALIARGWLDPNPAASDNIFRQLVEDVTSGRVEVGQAVNDASQRLQQLLGG